ncbi:MAG: hypothetical protein ACLGI9_02735 [Thermoanaerobaculia bacterium]
MKRFGFASVLVLLSLAMSQPAGAQYATGVYRFILDDELIKYVDFEARSDGKVTTGQLTFTDEAWISDFDVEDPRPGDSPPQLYLKASIDSLTVERNQAILGGTVRESSHRSYIGRWVQLVVEDNGNGLEVPDRLAWRLCQPPPGSWVPSDADNPRDDGAYLRWWATDAERKDDVGIPSVDLLAKQTSCPLLPLGVYHFAEPLKWEGDLIVQP